jgi:hypothetical protein
MGDRRDGFVEVISADVAQAADPQIRREMTTTTGA